MCPHKRRCCTRSPDARSTSMLHRRTDQPSDAQMCCTSETAEGSPSLLEGTCCRRQNQTFGRKRACHLRTCAEGAQTCHSLERHLLTREVAECSRTCDALHLWKRLLQRESNSDTRPRRCGCSIMPAESLPTPSALERIAESPTNREPTTRLTCRRPVSREHSRGDRATRGAMSVPRQLAPRSPTTHQGAVQVRSLRARQGFHSLDGTLARSSAVRRKGV